LRYEVGRALDKTVIAVHKSAWLKGRIEVANPLVAGSSIDSTTSHHLTLSTPATVPDLVQVSSALSLGELAPDVFKGGRLIQGSGAGPTPTPGVTPTPRKFFEILNISQDGSNLRMLLRPAIKGVVPENSSFVLEALPNYSAVLQHDGQIRALANSCPNAFSVITGNPVRFESTTTPTPSAPATMSFVDDVPGKGASRFFYKVRAVDASENRSDWSDASVAIHQVDTTAPSAPEIQSIESGDHKVILMWKNENDYRIVAYQVYRSLISETSVSAATNDLITTLWKNASHGTAEVAQQAYVTKRLNAIELTSLADAQLGIFSDGTESPRLTGIYRVLTDGSVDRSLNHFVDAPTRLDGRKVLSVNPALVDDQAIVIAILDSGGQVRTMSTSMRGDDQLRVSEHIVDLRFPYEDVTIVGVYSRLAFDFSAGVDSGQAARNYFLQSSSYDDATRTISGIDSELPEANFVVVTIEVTQDDHRERRVLQRRSGTRDLLQVINHRIELDLPFSPVEVRGIFKSEDYDLGLSPDHQSVVSFHLPKRTTYDGVRKVISDTNPLLANGEAVLLEVDDGNGALRQIGGIPSLYSFTDSSANGLRKDESYFYRLVAIKRVQVGSRQEDSIQVLSLPSRTVTAKPFDTRPPSPPEWVIVAWWDSVRNRAATASTTSPAISLTWKTSERECACTVYRSAERGVWTIVSDELRSNSRNAQGFWQFTYVDQAVDPHADYFYRVKLTNRLGIWNRSENEFHLTHYS
jgi:hypothetical protein